LADADEAPAKSVVVSAAVLSHLRRERFGMSFSF